MSNWVYPRGIIQIDGLTVAGMKKIYNLKNNKQLEEFLGNSNNWEHSFSGKYLRQDHTKKIKEFVESLSTPHGSEGDMETVVCNYDKFKKLWGTDSTSSDTRDYNPRTGELVDFGFGIDISEEQYEAEGWKQVWFEEVGVNFVIAVFGNLRNSSLDEFKKEFDEYLNNLKKWFMIDHIDIRATECYTDEELVWRDYDDSRITSNS